MYQPTDLKKGTVCQIDGQPFNDELLASFSCYEDHKFRTGFLEVYRD